MVIGVVKLKMQLFTNSSGHLSLSHALAKTGGYFFSGSEYKAFLCKSRDQMINETRGLAGETPSP